MTPEERAGKVAFDWAFQLNNGKLPFSRELYDNLGRSIATAIREAEAAARADERAELIRISGNWAIDPELTDVAHDIISAFQDEIWRRVRGQGQADAAE